MFLREIGRFVGSIRKQYLGTNIRNICISAGVELRYVFMSDKCEMLFELKKLILHGIDPLAILQESEAIDIFIQLP